jgi:hypothetical protein
LLFLGKHPPPSRVDVKPAGSGQRHCPAAGANAAVLRRALCCPLPLQRTPAEALPRSTVPRPAACALRVGRRAVAASAARCAPCAGLEKCRQGAPLVCALSQPGCCCSSSCLPSTLVQWRLVADGAPWLRLAPPTAQTATMTLNPTLHRRPLATLDAGVAVLALALSSQAHPCPLPPPTSLPGRT